MAATVDVPGLGHVKTKTALIGGGIALALVIAIIVVRQRSAAAAPASTAAVGAGDVATDPAGNVGVIDPATGFVYGSTQDVAALQAGAGAYDNTGGTGGLSGYYYGSGGGQTSAPGPGNFADNAEWEQYAIAYITGTLGGNPAATGTALGLYLAGKPIDPTQANIVDEATGVAGLPPVAGAGGDPPGIVTTTTTPPTPGTPSGLSVTPHAGFADFGWGAVKGAKSYELSVTGAGGKGTGTSSVDTTETGNHAEGVKLQPGKYHARVRVTGGKWTAVKTFTQPK